jgi:hypothetical protein
VSDSERRRLARLAGEGDLDAARRLVRILERGPVSRVTLPESRAKDVLSTRAMKAVVRTFAERGDGEPDALNLTLRRLVETGITCDELLQSRSCGLKTCAEIACRLEEAGLVIAAPSAPPGAQLLWDRALEKHRRLPG